MKTKKVKVTMSRIGINSLKEPRKVVYMPLAKIDYMGSINKRFISR